MANPRDVHVVKDEGRSQNLARVGALSMGQITISWIIFLAILGPDMDLPITDSNLQPFSLKFGTLLTELQRLPLILTVAAWARQKFPQIIFLAKLKTRHGPSIPRFESATYQSKV